MNAIVAVISLLILLFAAAYGLGVLLANFLGGMP